MEDGEACLTDDDCQSGNCLTDSDGFPGGYCTVAECESRRDCFGVDRACLRGEFNGNLCVNLCETLDDCRPGYECVGEATGSYCYPSYAGAALQPVCESEFIAADDVVAGGFGGFGGGGRYDRRAFTFELSEGVTSFAVIAYDRHYAVQPDLLIAPNGTEYETDRYAAYMYTPLTLERVAPMLFPGGPQFVDMVMPGEYTFEVGYEGPEDSSPCLVVIEEFEDLDPQADLLEVDLNFYFVGVPGLNSMTADSDSDFADMMDEFDSVMRLAGIRLGEVRYFDVTGDIEDTFEVIYTQQAAFDLVTLTRQPGSERRELLSANVFFIRGFSGNEMSSVLGISTGIPGVPGIHGQQGTGLVFSSEYLGGRGGSELVGQVLAHELGHFLGLFHTTEQSGGQTDHLADTPECADISRGNLGACPDYENLMFPIAAPRSDLVVSEGQSVILRANPLTHFHDE